MYCFLLLPEKGQELVGKLLHNNKALKLQLVIALICTTTHSITLYPQEQPIHSNFVPCTFNMLQKTLLKEIDACLKSESSFPHLAHL